MKHFVLKTIQPQNYYEMLLQNEKVRVNARSFHSQRDINIEKCEGHTVTVSVGETVCILTLTIVPNKNLLDLEPKIELSFNNSESFHNEHLVQLLNETIDIEYSPNFSPKVKVIIAVNVITNDGNIETAIATAIPSLIEKYDNECNTQDTDNVYPVTFSKITECKTLKIALVFKGKVCDVESMYTIVDPDKEEEDKFIDVEVLASFVQKDGKIKSKVSIHQCKNDAIAIPVEILNNVISTCEGLIGDFEEKIELKEEDQMELD
mmetsp:Transcript_17745/g.15664  ORF Transcript_17745/g.15664 Transcript_17745/m.15664 type:complete len:263 (+) Transcript_17745:19-807(+)